MALRSIRHALLTIIRVVTITAIVGSCAHFVSPPGPAIPDRPGYTDGPASMPMGAFQLEAGYTYDRAGTVTYSSIGETLLRIGVGAQSELRLFGNSYAIRSTDGAPTLYGMEDPKIGFKTSVHAKPDSVHSLTPNIAVLAALTLPAGGDAFRSAHVQPEAKLAANWTTPSPFSVYSNVAAGRVYDGREWGERGWVSVALWYSVNPKVSVFGEEISVRRLGGSASPSNDVDAGVTYLINDRFQLDLRAGHGFGSASGTERFIGAGFARRW